MTIRGRRTGAGLTLRRCAELMRVSMTRLSAIERGGEAMTQAEREAFEVAMQGARR